MTSRPGDPSPPPGERADAPAADLGDVWDALDALPRAASSIDMAATTIDMVAVAVDGPRSPAGSWRPGLRRWLLPAAAIASSLIAGVVAGRVTMPDPDARVLEYLPLIRHLGILQEAGSVTFLKAVAERKLPPPFWLPGGDLRGELREFDEALSGLEADHAWGKAAADRLAARRDDILALPASRRDELERAVTVFQGLTSTQRRDLATVATVLADPKRDDLRDAARTWHLWVAASDPPDRRNIIDLDTAGRLEWLDRRPRLRERDRGGERRGLPNGMDGPPPRGFENRPRRPGMGPGTPPAPGPGPGSRGGPPRPRGPDSSEDDRPPPPVSPPPPPETAAPPG